MVCVSFRLLGCLGSVFLEFVFARSRCGELHVERTSGHLTSWGTQGLPVLRGVYLTLVFSGAFTFVCQRVEFNSLVFSMGLLGMFP